MPRRATRSSAKKDIVDDDNSNEDNRQLNATEIDEVEANIGDDDVVDNDAGADDSSSSSDDESPAGNNSNAEDDDTSGEDDDGEEEEEEEEEEVSHTGDVTGNGDGSDKTNGDSGRDASVSHTKKKKHSVPLVTSAGVRKLFLAIAAGVLSKLHGGSAGPQWHADPADDHVYQLVCNSASLIADIIRAQYPHQVFSKITKVDVKYGDAIAAIVNSAKRTIALFLSHLRLQNPETTVTIGSCAAAFAHAGIASERAVVLQGNREDYDNAMTRRDEQIQEGREKMEQANALVAAARALIGNGRRGKKRTKGAAGAGGAPAPVRRQSVSVGMSV